MPDCYVKGMLFALVLGITGCTAWPAPQRMSDSAQQVQRQATYQALSELLSGQVLDWQSGEYQGQIAILATWQLEDGRYCRAVQQHVLTPVQAVQEGVACRTKEGRWQWQPR